MAETIIKGIGASKGVRMGSALVYTAQAANVELYDINAEDVDKEMARLKVSIEICQIELDDLIDNARQTFGEEKSVVLKGQKSMLADPSFLSEVEKNIRQKLYSPQKAVHNVVQNFAAIFENMPDEYMRERAADVRDMGRRLLLKLSGCSCMNLGDIRNEVILVSQDLAPSETVQLKKENVLAFVTAVGGKTSHTAIFARTLGIPAVLGCGKEIKAIGDGDMVIIDGNEGMCIVNPSEETINKYKNIMEVERDQQELAIKYAHGRAVTLDGHEIEIAANIGSPEDAQYAIGLGAEGVGLYRTELLFMSEGIMPDEETQYNAYRKAAQIMDGRPVIIRTLDIGGDKEVKYLDIARETNPFLGYRAIRLCLDRKELFLTQLRAILRASVYGKIKIMFPMISCMDEWFSAKAAYMEARLQLKAEGIPFETDIELGMMVEVPSAAVMAEQFADEVDFFSIGTNDLVQYTLAVDRMNEKVSYLYDHFHPAIITLIKNVADAAHKKGKWVGMCGGMAGDSLAVPLLAAMGFDELSMPAGDIAAIKYAISHLRLDECRRLLDKVLKLGTAIQIREACKIM